MKLVDGDGDKTLEVRASASGLALVLGRSGDGKPFVITDLDELLLMSVGRPWRREFPGLTDVRHRKADDGLQICAFLRGLHVTLALRFVEGLLHLDVSWTNPTDADIADLALGLVVKLPDAGDRVTMPQVLYNNNPSAAPDRVVPKLGLGTDGSLVVEEHRLPIPGVNVEWPAAGGARYLTLFARPSYVEDDAGRVTYGSLGARRAEQLSVMALSGVLSFNGEADVRYVHKAVTEPHAGGYLTLAPGEELRRSYVLDWGSPGRPGQGFRELVRQSRRLFIEEGARPLSLAEIIRYKTAALDDRWTEADGAAGYVKFNDTNPFGIADKKPLGFLYGWTGQCLRLAWCDAWLGVERTEPERIERCHRAVEFYLRGSATAVPGLRTSMYCLADREWSAFDIGGKQVVSSRAHGETVCELADVVLLFRARGLPVPDDWIAELVAAADFFCSSRLPSGIFPLGWLPDGASATDLICAAGLPAVLALLKAHRVTGREDYLGVAAETFERYHELHAETFDRPFARATLDAACEDKESGLYYFLGAYELHRLSGEEKYAERARLGADWLLTFVYCWNPRFDRDSPLDRRAFNSVGWPGVSVQNHHVDVFFPAYELWDFGRRIGEPDYTALAERTMYAMGQGIGTERDGWGFTVLGEQAEGFFPTDWQVRGTSNHWNPSWVIVQVLSAALPMSADLSADGTGSGSGSGRGSG